MRERGHARLLHVCVTYPPGPDGGLSTVTRNKAVRLIRRVPEKGVAVPRRVSNLHAISFLAQDA